MRQPNRELVALAVADGMNEQDAADQIEWVLGLIPRALIAGRPVRLPGVGDLRPKRKRAYVPGSCDRQAREECRVTMRAGTVWKGEPFACEPPEKSKLSYLNPKGLP